MAIQRRNRPAAGYTRLVAGFLFLVVFHATAQDTATEELTGPVSLVSPVVIRVPEGETVDIIQALDGVDLDSVTISGPVLPEGILIDDGPFLLGLGRSASRIETRLETTRPGRFIVPAPTVTVQGVPYPGSETLVEVFSEGDPSLIPYSARWRSLAAAIVEGQSVPLVLELYLIDQFTYPESISVRSPGEGLFEEVVGLGGVTTVVFGDIELFQIPVASFVFTPSNAGSVTIPGAQISGMGFKIQTDDLVLSVADLPGETRPHNGVGRFSVDVSVEQAQVSVGDSVEVVIGIDGTGNIPALRMPEVRTIGLVEVDSYEESRVEPDTDDFLGYRGTRTITNRFEVTGEEESVVIAIEPFIYFDPIDRQYRTIEGTEVRLEVITEKPVVDVPLDFPLYTIEELQDPIWTQLYRISWVYVVFLVPLVIRVGMEFARRRKSGIVPILSVVVLLVSAGIRPDLNIHRLERAQELVELGEFSTAGVLYDFEIQDHPDHAGLRRNRAVLALRSDRPSVTVYNLRKALRLRPANTGFRAELQAVQDLYQLNQQFHIPMVPRTDLWLVIGFVIWVVLWFLSLIPARAIRAIATFVVVLTGLVVAGTGVWSVTVTDMPEATVLDDVVIRRIPDSQARPWVTVEGATTVMVELGYDQFYLIRTRSGVEGWVPTSAVLFEGEKP